MSALKTTAAFLAGFALAPTICAAAGEYWIRLDDCRVTSRTMHNGPIMLDDIIITKDIATGASRTLRWTDGGAGE